MPIALVCPSCGTSNAAGNKFCGQCATPLDRPAQPRFPADAPESYTPKHLAEKILTSKAALEGERRQVTVLFVDVSGFTSLSERLDPEEVHRWRPHIGPGLGTAALRPWALNVPRVGSIIPIMGTKRTVQKRRPVVRPHGVADALFAKVQQRVLAVLFGNPRRSFYANEIIGLARSGTGAVQRELARLEAAGLVTVSHVGKQKHYQANAGSPLFEELRAVVLKTVGLADVLRAALVPVARGIRAAFVYGSIARGDDTAASDIDVMVISDRLTYADLFAALEGASAQLRRKIAPTIYSTKELAKRVKQDNAFVSRVLGQPKLWLIGDERDLTA